MNSRVLLIVGLFATAAIAFSGTAAEHTGVELTEPAAASCFEIPGDPECHPHPACLIVQHIPDTHCVL